MTGLKYAEFFTTEQVQQVHAASLEILENVGMLVRNDDARAVLSRHGCQVDSETEFVRFPRAVVEEFRTLCPPKFTFYARDPAYDITVPDDRPAMMTASSAPNIIDPITSEDRRARSDDMARIAHLINSCYAAGAGSGNWIVINCLKEACKAARYIWALS